MFGRLASTGHSFTACANWHAIGVSLRSLLQDEARRVGRAPRACGRRAGGCADPRHDAAGDPRKPARRRRRGVHGVRRGRRPAFPPARATAPVHGGQSGVEHPQRRLPVGHLQPRGPAGRRNLVPFGPVRPGVRLGHVRLARQDRDRLRRARPARCSPCSTRSRSRRSRRCRCRCARPEPRTRSRTSPAAATSISTIANRAVVPTADRHIRLISGRRRRQPDARPQPRRHRRRRERRRDHRRDAGLERPDLVRLDPGRRRLRDPGSEAVRSR